MGQFWVEVSQLTLRRMCGDGMGVLLWRGLAMCVLVVVVVVVACSCVIVTIGVEL
jgi:hypothetical protein